MSENLVAYLRVSTDEQATLGFSLAAQRSRITAYAKAMGHRIVAFEQDSLSGKVPPQKRLGLGKALLLVKQKKATGIVVLKLDRLSRSTRHILDLADDARRGGWLMMSMSEHLDTSNACGQFVLTLFGALAEMERKQIGERTKIGMAEIARQGFARSRRLPFGFRLEGASKKTELTAGDKRKLVRHPTEQRILKQMLAMKKAGQGSYRITSSLNAEGIFNPRTGQAWNPGTLAGILRTALTRMRAE